MGRFVPSFPDAHRLFVIREGRIHSGQYLRDVMLQVFLQIDAVQRFDVHRSAGTVHILKAVVAGRHDVRYADIALCRSRPDKVDVVLIILVRPSGRLRRCEVGSRVGQPLNPVIRLLHGQVDGIVDRAYLAQAVREHGTHNSGQVDVALAVRLPASLVAARPVGPRHQDVCIRVVAAGHLHPAVSRHGEGIVYGRDLCPRTGCAGRELQLGIRAADEECGRTRVLECPRHPGRMIIQVPSGFHESQRVGLRDRTANLRNVDHFNLIPFSRGAGHRDAVIGRIGIPSAALIVERIRPRRTADSRPEIVLTQGSRKCGTCHGHVEALRGVAGMHPPSFQTKQPRIAIRDGRAAAGRADVYFTAGRLVILGIEIIREWDTIQMDNPLRIHE